MPLVGLRTFLCKDCTKLQDLILKAIEVGYRYFDTARGYENEKFIGKMIKDILDKNIIKSEELFITTKILL